jgi:hypothetical protein
VELIVADANNWEIRNAGLLPEILGDLREFLEFLAGWRAIPVTGIDIQSVAGDHKEAERAINDALVILRTKVFHENKLAARLDLHNADYGQSRNFAGLRPVWLLTSFASCAVCWVTYAVTREHLAFPVVATALFVACLLAAAVVKGYVRHTARHYADSFFGALDACDEALQAKAKKKSAAGAAPPPQSGEATAAGPGGSQT